MIGERLDLVFCNEEEAKGWGRTDDLEAAIEALKAVARSFVITRGAKGAITYDGESLAHIDAHPVKAVDTNGAGDMFAGAFLYALGRGENYQRAGEFASLAAGRVVSQFGPRLPAAHYRALREEFFNDSL